MTKTTLLAAVAVGALAFAGSASAHDLIYRTGAAGGVIDSGDLNTTTGPGNMVAADQDLVKYGRSLVGLYLVAQEATIAQLGTNTVALSDLLTAGAQLPSGNNLYTITLTNGTFSAPVSTSNLTGANCTTVISSGGTTGSSSVTFVVSTSGGACAGFSAVDLPIAPAGPGTVSVTSLYQTDNNVQIDGPPDTLDVIFAIDAFQPAFNATFSTANAGPGAGADSFAQIAPATVGGMPYTVLAGDNDLGRTAIYVDARAQRTLTPGTFVTVGNVTAATLSVVGDFSAFNGTGAFPTLTTGTNPANGAAVVTATIAGNVATFAGAQTNITQLLANKPNGSVVEVTPDGSMIPTSNYSASLSFTLTPASFDAQPGAGTANNFETIEREGTNFIAAWTGGSQAGSQSVIRMSNTGVATGNVTLVLTNGVGSGNVAIADTSCNVGIVPAAGDLVIGAAQLSSCFGPFLRGDLLITVEGAPGSLTAKMRNTSASGTFETTLGRYSGSTITGAAQ